MNTILAQSLRKIRNRPPLLQAVTSNIFTVIQTWIWQWNIHHATALILGRFWNQFGHFIKTATGTTSIRSFSKWTAVSVCKQGFLIWKSGSAIRSPIGLVPRTSTNLHGLPTIHSKNLTMKRRFYTSWKLLWSSTNVQIYLCQIYGCSEIFWGLGFITVIKTQ